jgi:hypothetical protein
MGKTITATAVISASDATGNVFDRIAQKIKGVEKAAKSFGNLPPLFKNQLGRGSTFGFEKEINRLASSAKEFEAIRRSIERSYANFGSALYKNGPMKAATALGAIKMWEQGTLNSLRKVQSGYDGMERVHQRFFRGAGRFALMATAGGGAAYETGRGIRAGVKSAAERSREMARYGLGGLSEEEKALANAKADEIAERNPTVSRTDILGHIRQLRARLGSFEHAMDNVETLTRAQTVLGTLGKGGEHGAQDLEQLVLGLESQGIGSNPEKFKGYLNAFVKAKSLFPDLTGENFRTYMQRANASKYGLSEDYLSSVVPTMMQHGGAPNFGVEQASAFSALIGGRQTKEAKAAMRAAGLLGKDNQLIGSGEFVRHPYQWTKKYLQPSLEKKGISMDEEHRGDVVETITKMFSNRKVADFFTSMLVNRGIIEKDKELLKGAKGTEGADQARREDAFQASTAITTQLKDAAASFLKLQPVIDGMNALADRMSKAISGFDKGTPAEKTGAMAGVGLLGGGAAAAGVLGAKGLYQWFTGGAAALNQSAALLDASAAALTAAAAKLAGGATLAQVAGGGAAGAAAKGGGVLSKAWPAVAGALPFLGVAGLGAGAYFAAEAANDYSGITRESTRERQRKQRAKYNWWGKYSPDGAGMAAPEVSPTMTYGTGVGGDKQVSVTVTGEVSGEGKVVLEINAGSSLLDVVKRAEAAIKLAGQVNSNGPGSTGKSYPDAAAPARPSTGAAFNGVP